MKTLKTILVILILILAVLDWMFFIYEKDEQKRISHSIRSLTALCLAILVEKMID